MGKTLGAGTYGIVREADCSEGKVAIKIILKKNVKGNEQMVYDELDMLQRMHHPHIVRFHDWFESKACISYRTDLCPTYNTNRTSTTLSRSWPPEGSSSIESARRDDSPKRMLPKQLNKSSRRLTICINETSFTEVGTARPKWYGVCIDLKQLQI